MTNPKSSASYNSTPTRTNIAAVWIDEHNTLLKRVEELEKRLLIIPPNEALQEKYPALKEAYEAYKIIEKLVYDRPK